MVSLKLNKLQNVSIMNIYNESIISNGLRVITFENSNSEIVIISIWIRSGARCGDESQGGYAHFLEHMMLKGSKKYPSVLEFSKIKDRAGAISDGLTNADRVCFYIKVAKNQLEKMFELLSDMILNPIIDPVVLENEKQVILQELYKSNDNNDKRIWQFSLESAFNGHPLSRNNLGTESSISLATVNSLRDYYNTYFTPDRSAIIVTGSVKHDEILMLIDKFLGAWNISGGVFNDTQSLNIKKGFFFRKIPTKQTFVAFNFVGNRPSFKESLILEVISTYLSYGTSSFLYQVLRHERGLIYGVSSSNNIFEDANLFYIKTSTTKPKEVVGLVSEKINNLENYFTESVFEELKEQCINIFTLKIENIEGEFNFLGNNWRIYNKLILPEEIINAIRMLEYTDFIEIKNKYLNESNLVITAIGENEF